MIAENRTDGAPASIGRYVLDGLLLSAPPVVLVGVFLAPRPVRESLVFAYDAPTLATAFAANYVHFTLAHLATNVLSYLLVAAVGYLLGAFGGFGDRYRAAGAGYLLGLAPALSVLNLAVPRPGTTFGFSGVVLSFYGLLCFALGRYAERRLLGRRARLPRVVFFVAVGVVAAVAGPTVATRVGVAVVALALAVAHASGEGLGAVDWGAALADERRGGLLVAGGVLVLAYPLAAFPSDATLAGGVVNLYAHFLGFALGFLAVWTFDRLAVVGWAGR